MGHIKLRTDHTHSRLGNNLEVQDGHEAIVLTVQFNLTNRKQQTPKHETTHALIWALNRLNCLRVSIL